MRGRAGAPPGSPVPTPSCCPQNQLPGEHELHSGGRPGQPLPGDVHLADPSRQRLGPWLLLDVVSLSLAMASVGGEQEGEGGPEAGTRRHWMDRADEPPPLGGPRAVTRAVRSSRQSSVPGGLT